MKKLTKIIDAGGTIACTVGKNAHPTKSIEFIIEQIPEATYICDLELSSEKVPSIDSSEMTPIVQEILMKAIYNEISRPNVSGVVVTHGTDTMAFNAALCSFVIKGLSKPVVFTGSQRKIGDDDFDGLDNLANAISVSAEPMAGSYIVFHNRIINGVRARKINSMELDAFRSINEPEVGNVYKCIVNINNMNYHSIAREFNYTGFSPNVGLFVVYPGLRPYDLDLFIKEKEGIVLLGYGLGNLPFDNPQCPGSDIYSLEGVIKKSVKSGKLIVIGTQCLDGGTSADEYKASNIFMDLGAISTKDMTPEAALAKLAWVVYETADLERRKELMLTNII